MNPSLIILSIASLCLVWPSGAIAQRQRPPQVQSPVVHPDRTVTFNFRAPTAKQVEINTQFTRGNRELTKDTTE